MPYIFASPARGGRLRRAGCAITKGLSRHGSHLEGSVALVVGALIGLAGYAYLGDMSPQQVPVTQR